MNGDLVIKKINDYHIGQDHYLGLLENRITSLSEIVNSDDFLNQMKRFIASDVLDSTLLKSGFNGYLISTVENLLIQTKRAIASDPTDDIEFGM